MDDAQNQAQFYWQASASADSSRDGPRTADRCGDQRVLELRDLVGVCVGVARVPLLGVLVGAICGGVAGIAGSLYTSSYGKLLPFILTAFASVATTAALGALLSGLSRTNWVYSAIFTLPASLALGVLLPGVAERYRKARSERTHMPLRVRHR